MEYLIGGIGLLLLGYFLGCGMTLFIIIIYDYKNPFSGEETIEDKSKPWKNKNG